jgi:hypothetical protein
MISRGEAKRSPPKPAVATEVVRGPDPQGAKVLSGFILKKPLPIGGYRSARQILARGPAPYKGVRLKSPTKQKRKNFFKKLLTSPCFRCIILSEREPRRKQKC